MTKRFATGVVFALFSSGAVVACLSSTPPATTPGDDGGFTPCTSDGSVATAATQIGAGLCSSCVQTQCGTLLASCATDCTCNDTALQALSCLENLGLTPSTAAITSCVTPLGNSTDSTLEQLGSCLQGCAGACGVDAGKDAAIAEAGTDATVSSEAGTDAGVTDTGSDVAVVDTGIDAADAGTDSPSTCITTVSGTVYDPVGVNPLPGVSVYTPAGSLAVFPSGAVCSCSGLTSPYASGTVTDANGQFTLSLPEESSFALIVQTGKWRRQFSEVITPCADNPLGKLQLPSSSAFGQMPDIAVSTGGSDSLECLLRRVGIADTEWVAGAGTGGHIHVFSGGNGAPDAGTQAGLPEKHPFPGAPASSLALWDSTADLMKYDLLLLSCEGAETYNANPAMLESYLDLGGRVLASHFHYSWFAGALVSGQGYAAPGDWGTHLATWTGGAALGDGGTSPTVGAIPQTTLTGGGAFAKGVTANAWLGDVGALTSGEVPILTPKYNAHVSAANTPSQPWLLADNASGDPGAAMLFTFDTPVNAASDSGTPPTYCGRAAFTDLHDDAADTTNTAGAGSAAPGGCATGALSPQEKELELLLFDLGGCVIPDTATPSTLPP